MELSALYIKHLPVSKYYTVCFLADGEVQTVLKNFTDLDAAVKALVKMAKTQPGLYKFAFENLYVNVDKVTDVQAVDKEVIVTCDGKNFTAAVFHSPNNARNYSKLLRQAFKLEDRKCTS